MSLHQAQEREKKARLEKLEQQRLKDKEKREAEEKRLHDLEMFSKAKKASTPTGAPSKALTARPGPNALAATQPATPAASAPAMGATAPATTTGAAGKPGTEPRTVDFGKTTTGALSATNAGPGFGGTTLSPAQFEASGEVIVNQMTGEMESAIEPPSTWPSGDGYTVFQDNGERFVYQKNDKPTTGFYYYPATNNKITYRQNKGGLIMFKTLEKTMGGPKSTQLVGHQMSGNPYIDFYPEADNESVSEISQFLQLPTATTEEHAALAAEAAQSPLMYIATTEMPVTRRAYFMSDGSDGPLMVPTYIYLNTVSAITVRGTDDEEVPDEYRVTPADAKRYARIETGADEYALSVRKMTHPGSMICRTEIPPSLCIFFLEPGVINYTLFDYLRVASETRSGTSVHGSSGPNHTTIVKSSIPQTFHHLFSEYTFETSIVPYHVYERRVKQHIQERKNREEDEIQAANEGRRNTARRAQVFNPHPRGGY